MTKAYFMGAGPGDPGLLTLSGAECLAISDAVFVPTPYEETFAGLLQGKEILVPFRFYFDELVNEIRDRLRTGHVSFLIPGDLTIFSPFQCLIDELGDDAEVIPGVGVANAASAYLRKTLDLPDVCGRTVIASPRILGEDGPVPMRELAAPGVTLMIYMNNLPLAELVTELRAGYGENVPIAIFHRLCLPGQEVVTGSLDDIVARVGDQDFFNLGTERKRPALTLVIAGKTLDGETDGAWWDYRREHVWKNEETES